MSSMTLNWVTSNWQNQRPFVFLKFPNLVNVISFFLLPLCLRHALNKENYSRRTSCLKSSGTTGNIIPRRPNQRLRPSIHPQRLRRMARALVKVKSAIQSRWNYVLAEVVYAYGYLGQWGCRLRTAKTAQACQSPDWVWLWRRPLWFWIQRRQRF